MVSEDSSNDQTSEDISVESRDKALKDLIEGKCQSAHIELEIDFIA